MKPAVLYFYDSDTEELRWQQRSDHVPRIGDKVAFPSGRMVLVTDLMWSWPEVGSVAYQRGEGPMVQIRIEDVPEGFFRA